MSTELKVHELSAATGMAHPSLVRKPGILIADDMQSILTVLKCSLESRGFNVWLAMDGDDALDLYRQYRQEIDLVLLDVQMPGLNGPQTLVHLRRLDPDLVACFMTGNSGAYTEEELLECGVSCVFNKPFRPVEVADLLQRLASAPCSTRFVCDWQTSGVNHHSG
jgi:CheY-like chemotaxis protein